MADTKKLTRQRARRILTAAARHTVLVTGDAMLDQFIWGNVDRISPEAPVPVVKVDQIEDRPGGAGNVALNIAALGAPAWLVGVTGKDEAAHSLQQRLNGAEAGERLLAICACVPHAKNHTPGRAGIPRLRREQFVAWGCLRPYLPKGGNSRRRGGENERL